MARTDAATIGSPRIIAMLNQKGGVGKTTTTVNLGAGLAAAGRRVCLIDLDPQAHLTLHLGVDPERMEHSVYDLMIDPDVPAAAAILKVRDGLDVVPAEVDLAATEVELAHHPHRQGILQGKFAPLLSQYDVVLIDCPPSLGLLTLNALTLAKEVIVPMQAHFLALQGVGKLLETVGLVCRSVNPDLVVSGIVLCMHEGQTTLAKEIVADLEGFFEQCRDEAVPWRQCRLLRPPIRRNIKLAEAPSFGQTIFDYAPWCPGAIDYRLLAEGVIAQWEAEQQQQQQLEAVEPSSNAEVGAVELGSVRPSASIEDKPEPIDSEEEDRSVVHDEQEGSQSQLESPAPSVSPPRAAARSALGTRGRWIRSALIRIGAEVGRPPRSAAGVFSFCSTRWRSPRAPTGRAWNWDLKRTLLRTSCSISSRSRGSPCCSGAPAGSGARCSLPHCSSHGRRWTKRRRACLDWAGNCRGTTSSPAAWE